MSAAERLVLRTGPGPLLEAGHLALAVLAAVALLSAPTAWAWRLPALVLLALTYLVTRRRMKRQCPDFRLFLFSDGTALAEDSECKENTLNWPAGHAWASRQLCMLPVNECANADIIHCVILASRNNADDYRRLLSWLRLGVGVKKKVVTA